MDNEIEELSAIVEALLERLGPEDELVNRLHKVAAAIEEYWNDLYNDSLDRALYD